MEDGQLHFPGVIGNGDGKHTGVLVVHVDEIDAVIRLEGSQTQALPMEQVLGHGQGYPWALGRERRIGHHVALE